MANLKKFRIMDSFKEDIRKRIKNMGGIVTSKELDFIMSEFLVKMNSSGNVSQEDLLGFLIKYINLQIQHLYFLRGTYDLIYLNDTSFKPIEKVAKLTDRSYLSHYSAAYLHNLARSEINSVYVNIEQTKKKEKETYLDQQKIDQALIKPARESNNLADLDGQKIHLLNGQHTNNLGVLKKGDFFVTDVERTLIDIAVRPHYAGGLNEVLSIYKNSKGLFSIERLVFYLKTINFIYPYHQSIGFLLQTAGYEESYFNCLKKFQIEYNFYLAHNMENPQYSSTWKLFYPRDLKR